jgi:hypothetical protein
MSEADDLLARLDGAPDADARQALIAGRPQGLLEELRAALVYRKSKADVAEHLAAERAAFEAFTAELDAAPDDAARLQLIEAARRSPQRGERFVAEWAWRKTADAAAWGQRYLAMLQRCAP